MEDLKITISTSNSKLGNLIPSFNLPPIITCRKDAPCKKTCYACKGTFLFKNVKLSALNNLQAFFKDREKTKKYILSFLNNKLVAYKYFRWFSSGDIVNKDFLKMIVEIANETKQTKFLCFTKQFEIVNDFIKENEIPKNLIIIYSHWDKNFKVENPNNFASAYVSFKDPTLNEEIPTKAFKCKNDCSKCLRCWNLKKGESVYFNQH